MINPQNVTVGRYFPNLAIQPQLAGLIHCNYAYQTQNFAFSFSTDLINPTFNQNLIN